MFLFPGWVLPGPAPYTLLSDHGPHISPLSAQFALRAALYFSMSVPYRHTQFGVVTMVSLGLAAVGTVVIVFFTRDWVGLVIAAVLLLSVLAFMSLTVEVNGEAVHFRFGVGLIRKTFVLTDIESVRVVRNSWLYGWGIRYTPHGWLYNVSGLGAVELQLRSGKKVRIGSDEPEELATAVDEALGVRV